MVCPRSTSDRLAAYFGWEVFQLKGANHTVGQHKGTCNQYGWCLDAERRSRYFSKFSLDMQGGSCLTCVFRYPKTCERSVCMILGIFLVGRQKCSGRLRKNSSFNNKIMPVKLQPQSKFTELIL